MRTEKYKQKSISKKCFQKNYKKFCILKNRQKFFFTNIIKNLIQLMKKIFYRISLVVF